MGTHEAQAAIAATAPRRAPAGPVPEATAFAGPELRFLHGRDDTDGSIDLFKTTVQP